MFTRRRNDDQSRIRLQALASQARADPTVVFAKSEDADGSRPPGPLRRLTARRGVLVPGAGVAVLVIAIGLWAQRPAVERPPELAAVVTSAAPERVVVNVVGEVPEPGLVTVTSGARVADAVQAAGGLKPGAHLHGLNLARKVADGEQLEVGVPPTAQGGGGQQKLDLNSATKEELDGLPGVGPVTAQRIVDWRTRHGPFASVEQLREVEGIGASKLARLSELVRA